MADQTGKQNRQGKKRPRLNYFFLNDELHKKLLINRGKDLLVAWNYPGHKKVAYDYSTTLRRMERAFSTREVVEMVNRKHYTIELAIKHGMIEAPQHTYGLDENKNFYQYRWREKDIMGLLDYLSTVHQGRPRSDGMVTSLGLPTPRELRAMIHGEAILYVKQGDTFVPSWRAKELT